MSHITVTNEGATYCALTSHGFVLPHLCLLGPHPNPSCKTLIFVNLPQNYYYYFFNKTCFINKNILEITNKFIPSNQTKF